MAPLTHFGSPPPPSPPAPYLGHEPAAFTDSNDIHRPASSPSTMSAHGTYFNPGGLDQQQQQQQQQRPYQQMQQQHHHHHHHHLAAPTTNSAAAYGQPIYDTQTVAYHQPSAPLGYGVQANNSSSFHGMGMYQPIGGYPSTQSDHHMLQQQQQQHSHYTSYPHSTDGVASHHPGGHMTGSNGHSSVDSLPGPSSSPGASSPNSTHQGMRPKRRQVKNACINCQKACKKCDEGRPCTRCIKYGLTDTCIDSMRKERKRGIKRGPYKRRATTGSTNMPSQSAIHGAGSSHADAHANGSALNGNGYDSQSHSRSESGFEGSLTGSYDVNGYPVQHPSSASSSYRSLAGNNNPSSSAAYGFGSSSNASSANYGASPSPSLFPRPNNGSGPSAWASSPIEGHSRLPGIASGGYPASHAPNGLSIYTQDIRSSSAPLGAQGSPVSASFAVSGGQAAPRQGVTPSPASYSAHPLRSPMGIGGMLGSTGRGLQGGSAAGNGVFSPPALPSTAGSYLAASSSSHNRLHSDGSLAYSSSSGSTANFSSPRTPLSAGGNDMSASQVHLLGGSAADVALGGAGPYIKSPAAYVHHPPSMTTSVGSSFAQQQQQQQHGQHASAMPRPFPLHMPQLPRGNGNASREMTDDQSVSSLHGRTSSRSGEYLKLEA